MKTTQNCLALRQLLFPPSPVIFKILKSIFAVLVLSGSGFVLAQGTSSIISIGFDGQFNEPMTISDGCEQYITVSGPNYDLVSKKLVVIKRGTYQYLLKVVVNSQGALGTFYSEGGEVFHVNDELIFITLGNARMSVRFIGVSEDGLAASLPLNTELIERMATDPVTTIFIKNNVKNQMLKFNLNEDRQLEFQSMMNCIIKMQ